MYQLENSEKTLPKMDELQLARIHYSHLSLLLNDFASRNLVPKSTEYQLPMCYFAQSAKNQIIQNYPQCYIQSRRCSRKINDLESNV